MHDTTALAPPTIADYTPADNPRFVRLHRRFPTVAYLRRHASRHVPRFAFEYLTAARERTAGLPATGRRSTGWNWCRATA